MSARAALWAHVLFGLSVPPIWLANRLLLLGYWLRFHLRHDYIIRTSPHHVGRVQMGDEG